MADLIDRQAAIDAVGANTWAGSRIRKLPSAQTEIIRCKDCKYHEDEEPGMIYCPNRVGGWVSEDFFCKDGKRRDE